MPTEVEALTPSQQTIPDRLTAITKAMELGVSPEALTALGNQELPSADDGDRKFVRWATIGTAALVGGGVVANQMVPDVHVGETARQLADIIFTPGNASVAQDSLKTIARQAAQWGVYFGESSILIGYLLNGIKSRLARSDQLQALTETRARLRSAIESGTAPISMPDNYTAIDLGSSGDAIGRGIGQEIGWGTQALPLIEGDKNVSGFDVWGSLPNPSTGIEKEEFFKALDRVQFEKAQRLILCPVQEDQAFLPDPNNPDHFDLDFAEIMDRVGLLDEYARARGIDPKEIVIIGDKGMERSVAPYTRGGVAVEPQTYTLEQIIHDKNKERAEGSQIIIVDPTEIVLDLLRGGGYNPDGLPLEFFEDPHAQGLYGERFAEGCEALGIPIKTSGDDSPSLHVIYGENDIATRQTTGMLAPGNTVAIIIDETRAVDAPYQSVVLSQAVREWVISNVINRESPGDTASEE